MSIKLLAFAHGLSSVAGLPFGADTMDMLRTFKEGRTWQPVQSRDMSGSESSKRTSDDSSEDLFWPDMGVTEKDVHEANRQAFVTRVLADENRRILDLAADATDAVVRAEEKRREAKAAAERAKVELEREGKLADKKEAAKISGKTEALLKEVAEKAREQGRLEQRAEDEREAAKRLKLQAEVARTEARRATANATLLVAAKDALQEDASKAQRQAAQSHHQAVAARADAARAVQQADVAKQRAEVSADEVRVLSRSESRRSEQQAKKLHKVAMQRVQHALDVGELLAESAREPGAFVAGMQSEQGDE